MLKRVARIFAHALFMPWFGVLAACTSAPAVIEAPKISVQDVSVHDVSFREGTALLTLNVFNPNSFPIPLQGVGYTLRLNGVMVASGEQRQRVSLPAREPAQVQVPVRMQLGELFGLIPTFIRERKVQYDLQGAVRLPVISIPFQRQGGIGVEK